MPGLSSVRPPGQGEETAPVLVDLGDYTQRSSWPYAVQPLNFTIAIPLHGYSALAVRLLRLHTVKTAMKTITCSRFALGLATLLIFSSALTAQEFRGTLSGLVTDPSGAVVPRAEVRAVNQATRQVYTATTTTSGDYIIPYVLPGTYTVSVAADGFKTKVQDNVVLPAGASPVLNVTMEIGASTETITVSGTAELLEAENSVGNNVLTTRELENIPLNGRQIYTMLGTIPGSQFLQTQFGASGYSGTRAWDVSNNYTLGGGVQSYQQFTLNGSNITMQNNGAQGTWELAPNVDALQEVNVQTTNYDARYGRSGGGLVSMVVKNGSNEFHGSAYEYLENGVLNANNFENNLNGIPRQGVKQNQFGGTFGGPVKKNRIFFFGSYEGYRQRIPFTTLGSVPPAYLRPQSGQGVNFTQTGYTIFDPATLQCSTGEPIGSCSGSLYRSPFPNDTIPASNISSVGAATENLFPLPNTNGGALLDNYIANVPGKYRYDQPIVRVDYDTSDKTRLYSLFAFQHGTEFRDSSGFPAPAENGNINSMRQELMASQDMTHTFSPALLVDVKVSLSRFQDNFPNGDVTQSYDPATLLGLHMPSVPTTTKQLLPQFTFSEIYPQLVGNSVSTDTYNNIGFNSDFTLIKGKHTIHFGGELSEIQYANPGSVGSPNGYFNFGTDFTQASPAGRYTTGVKDGFTMADLLLGYPDIGSGLDYNNTIFEGYPVWAFYAQDNWHISRRLTLNIGLRYDVQDGVRERHNSLNRGMCLTCVNPISNDPVYQATLQAYAPYLSGAGVDVNSLATLHGGILFAGQNGLPRDAYNTDYSNIGPRFGFAYQVNPKTVVRGGWGLMYTVGMEAGTNQGYSESTLYTGSINPDALPGNQFATGNPFPSGILTPPGSSLGLLTGVGNNQTLDFPGRRIPRSQQFSLGFQRELPSQILLEARYAGNYTDRLRTGGGYSGGLGSIMINGTWTKQQIQYAAANPDQFYQGVPNPFYGIPSVPASSLLGGLPGLPAFYLDVPYPQFPGPLGDYTDPLGKSWYNALEIKVDKRLSRGVTFRAAYTYSKTMQATGYLNTFPYQDPELLRQIAPTDRTHIFSLTGVYNLPDINPGSALGKALGMVANHWVLSNVLSVETGLPEGLPGAQSSPLPGLGLGFNYVSSHSFMPDGGSTTSQWLYNCGGNPLNCWQPDPNPFYVLTLPNQISALRQPQVPNLDLSLERNFPIRERIRLQFRADAFNVANSVLFPGPDTNPYDGGPVRQANGTWTGFGTIPPYQNNFPRILQVSLKLVF